MGITRRITSQRTKTHCSASFPLAAASLNVSLMLCSHFRLVPMAGGAGAVAPCSDATLRKLLSLQQTVGMVASASPLSGATAGGGAAVGGGSDGGGSGGSGGGSPAGVSTPQVAALDLMHEKLLLRLHDAWLALPPGSPRIMRFPLLLAELRQHLRCVCANTPGAWSIGPASILAALRSNAPDRCASASSLLGCADPLERRQLAQTLRSLPTISRVLGIVVLLCGICPPVASAAPEAG